MSIRVLFFASLQAITGSGELEWPCPESGRTVDELLHELYDRFDGLRDWDRSLLVAADLEYVGRTTRVWPGQEVALMPPVQGG